MFNHSVKQAQISSQVFIFILAALIISLTLIFGVKTLITLKKTGNDAALLTFQKYLERTINSIDSGEELTINLNLPSNVRQVCFCGEGCNPSSSSESREVVQYINNERTGNTNNTVFLVYNDYSVKPIKISHLTSSFLCINKSARVKLIGKGKSVSVELP